MFADHWIIAQLIGQACSIFLLAIASWISLNIIRKWEPVSATELQIKLERQTYLISSLVRYVLFFQIISLFVFLFTVNNHLPGLIRGAMCASGTLTVNTYGYPLLFIKIFAIPLYATYLFMDHLDQSEAEYPLTPHKFWFVIPIFIMYISDFIITQYYDEDGKRKIKIEIAKKSEENYSPLSLPILDKIVPHNILRPIVKDKSLLEIIRERILSTAIRLVCIYNADWEGIRVVKNLPDSIKCPECGSTLISVAYRGDSDLYKIIKKKKKLKKLTKEESEIWNRAWKSASLVQNYGKKAIIVLASRGVGPTVASRILRKFIRNDSEFFKELLKAEREYQRTRSFWD